VKARDARARFLLTFVLLLVLELGTMVWAFGRNLDVPVNQATARAAASALSAMGADCGAKEDLVVCGSFSSVRIIFECTGVFPVGIFLAAVVAFPVAWGWRVLGVGLGVPAILAVNLGRVMSLLWLSDRFPRAVEWTHVVLWQTLMIVFVVAAWLLWARTAVRRPSASRA